jgi:hypothetical protein
MPYSGKYLIIWIWRTLKIIPALALSISEISLKLSRILFQSFV